MARPDSLGERLAVLVGATQSAEIRALAAAGAGDKESHVSVALVGSTATQSEREQRSRCYCTRTRQIHRVLPEKSQRRGQTRDRVAARQL
jgi:hypothetical protein